MECEGKLDFEDRKIADFIAGAELSGPVESKPKMICIAMLNKRLLEDQINWFFMNFRLATYRI